MGFLVGGNFTEPNSGLTDGKAFGLGDRMVDHVGNTYIYVLASGSPAQYDALSISSAYVAQQLTSALAATGVPIGVAMATLSSGSYGWACVKGTVSVNVLQTCSSSTALYTSGTAGKLDDTTTSQVKVAGVVILANNATTATAAALSVIAGDPYPVI
jgi:hypothetical protein